jgi:lipid-A-disaccharide synthase
MAPIVDEVLAILPFEPEAHRRLGGPPCLYVGHPLLAAIASLRPAPSERAPLTASTRPVLLVLPGSRHSEVSRLMAPFGAAVARIATAVPTVEIVVPAVARLRGEIEARVKDWPVQPILISGDAAKLAAFRRAHAALAASGTVTLELALAAVPMVVAYRVELLVRMMKGALKAKSIVLANLVLGENVIPEFLDSDCTPERLAASVIPLLRNSPARAAQLAAFARLDNLMATSATPSELAAAAVVDVVAGRRAKPPAARLAVP